MIFGWICSKAGMVPWFMGLTDLLYLKIEFMNGGEMNFCVLLVMH